MKFERYRQDPIENSIIWLIKHSAKTRKFLRDEVKKEVDCIIDLRRKAEYYKFDFVITDIETILESDEIIEEIQVISRTAPLIPRQKSIFDDDDDVDYYYLIVFWVILTVFLSINYVIACLRYVYYEVHAIVFPYDPRFEYLTMLSVKTIFYNPSLAKDLFYSLEPVINFLIDYFIEIRLFF